MPASAFVRGLFGLASLAVVAVAPQPSLAGDGAEGELRTLYRVALSAEMCGFPIGAKQADALGRAMNHAIADLGLDDDGVEALYRKIDGEFEAEGWDAICAADGDWARGYRRLLAAVAR